MTKGLEGNFRKRDHFGFEFHCKPIVAMHGIAKALLCKTFAVAKRIDAREMKPRHSPACVFSGMIASTCLDVLFVPTFFVVVRSGSRIGWHSESAGHPTRRRSRRPNPETQDRPGPAATHARMTSARNPVRTGDPQRLREAASLGGSRFVRPGRNRLPLRNTTP
jgi:hypothetical protein